MNRQLTRLVLVDDVQRLEGEGDEETRPLFFSNYSFFFFGGVGHRGGEVVARVASRYRTLLGRMQDGSRFFEETFALIVWFLFSLRKLNYILYDIL